MRRLILALVLLAVMAAAVFAQNTVNLLNTRFNAESTGNVLTLPFSEWWMAATCELSGPWGSDWHYHTPATDAPSPNCSDTSPTVGVYGSLEFHDSATEYLYRDWIVPSGWTGAIDLKIVWFSVVTSGNVVWQIKTFCTADNETLDTSTWTYNAAQTITDAAKGSGGLQNLATLAGVTTTGCAAGEVLHLKLYRDPTHASDTLAASAYLLGVEWTFRRAI